MNQDEYILSRKEILQHIVQHINYDYEKCLDWINHFNGKFGYITFAYYVRMIESRPFCRPAKNDLLILAMMKMDFGCYENFFIESKNISELYQKIFMLIMIENLFENFSCSTKNLQSFIIWEVIAKYFIEEHQRLLPFDFEMNNSNHHSTKRKIFDFFLKKNINLQDKMNLYLKKDTFFDSIINYFYHSKIESNESRDCESIPDTRHG